MSNAVRVHYDGLTDVLCAYVDGTRSRTIEQASKDNPMLLERDGEGEIIGVQVLEALRIIPERWKESSDRESLPQGIRYRLDRWFSFPREVSFQNLMARLIDAGMDETFVRMVVLPDWWCEEAERDPVVLAEIRILIGRFIGVSSIMLMDPLQPLNLFFTSK